MRLLKLGFPAYGPFTEHEVTFPEGGSDLHLFYGPNEAGKSTTLAGIHDLFFGFGHRTEQDFLHPGKKLRLTATVEEKGNLMSFQRLKKRKGALRDQDGNELADDALAPFLGTLNEGFFRGMFGIDSQRLREEAEKLLSADSDFGSLLFSASLGGRSVEEGMQKLKEEADKIYTTFNAKSKKLALLAGQRKELLSRARQLRIAPSRWTKHKRELRKAREKFEDAKKALLELRRERDQVKGFLSAGPTLRELGQLEGSLAELEFEARAEDFIEDKKALLQEVRTVRESVSGLETRKEELEERIRLLPDLSAIRERAADFQTLRDQRQSEESDREELINLEREAVTLTAKLAQLPEGAPEGAAVEFRSLAGRRKELLKELELHGRELEELEQEFEENAEGEVAPNEERLIVLQRLLRNFKEFLPLYRALDEERGKERACLRKVEQLRERLGLVKDERASHLRVPEEGVIRRFEVELRDGRENLNRLKSELREQEELKRGEAVQWESFQKRADFSSIGKLEEARLRRDALIKGGAAQEEILAAAHGSDRLADLMRDRVELMEKAASSRKRLLESENRLQSLSDQIEDGAAALKELEERWLEVLSGLPGARKDPELMLGWRSDWTLLIEREEELLELRERRIQSEEVVDGFHQTLHSLGFQGSPLPILNDEVEAESSQIQRQAGAREEAAKEKRKRAGKLKKCRSRISAKKEEWAQHQKVWQRQCGLLGIAPELTPGEAEEELERKEQARALSLSFHTVTERLAAMRQRQKERQALVQALAKMTGEAPETEALLNRYQQSVKQDGELATLRRQLREVGAGLSGERRKVAQLNNAVETAEKELGGNLEARLRELEEKNRIEKLRTAKLANLTEIAQGLELEDFRRELSGMDRVSLEARLEEIQPDLERLETLREDALLVLNQQEEEGRLLAEADDEAAYARQGARNTEAQIVDHARRLIVLRQAVAFLQRQIEEYREEAQGPMMERTSRYFRALTCGCFSRVVAEVGKDGKPNLLAIREGQETRLGRDEMSEGTVDQLYLSLRLAAIETHLESYQSFPLVLDDLLMTFDDERGAALLGVLEEFSQRVGIQILLFTHHEHVLHLAEEAAPAAHRHRLGQTG